MFEYQNKSTLEVLLESDSIAGFFTNMELITLIADADAQAIEMLQTALDDAQLQADIKLQYAEEMQAIADEKKRQLDELESLIGTTEAAISDFSPHSACGRYPCTWHHGCSFHPSAPVLSLCVSFSLW